MTTKEALHGLCSNMFTSPDAFPTAYWAAQYPLPVVLYGLLQAQQKQTRNSKMTPEQLSNFAATVMRRRFAELQARHT